MAGQLVFIACVVAHVIGSFALVRPESTPPLPSDSSSSQPPPPTALTSISNTVVYCPPPQPNSILVGGHNEQGTGSARRQSVGKAAKGHSNKLQLNDYASDSLENGQAYEREGKYWLVPPFLIGASSIVVIYVSVHCLYMHCSCISGAEKHRRRPAPGGQYPIRRVQIAGRTAGHRGPTIVFSDTDGGSPQTRTTASGSQLVPLVCYGDEIGGMSGGRAAARGGRPHELLEAQPFLIYEQCDDSLDYYDEQPSTSRKGSGFLQLPAAIGRRLSQARLSFSSMGRGSRRDREPRASLCFVPVTRAISDPSGVPGDECGSGQTRFEAYYCRSCGAHNVVEVGGSASVQRPSDAARAAKTLTSPDGNASTTGGTGSPVETDLGPLIGRQSSTLELHLTTRPVPTILVEDDTATERSATESCTDQGGVADVDNYDRDDVEKRKDVLASVVVLCE